jgi:hypothetical protein
MRAQGVDTSRCLPHTRYEPTLIDNPSRKVTFQCEKATALEAIRAVGFQARIPIGVVLGRDLDALSKASHRFDFVDLDARSALLIAIEGTGYSIKEEGDVMVIVAGDLAPRQRELLVHSFSHFRRGQASGKMICLGMDLTGWLRVAANPGLRGYGISCSTSTNEEEITLNIPPAATTEKIANQLVSQGSKGMWVFKVPASVPAGDPTEEISFLPYQHYSDKPIAGQ